MCKCEAKVFLVGVGKTSVGCGQFSGLCMLTVFREIGKEKAVAEALGKKQTEVISVDVVDKSDCQIKASYNG